VKPIIFLRAASLLSLLAFLGHTFLFVSYVPTHGPEEVALVAAMKSHHFSFGGFTHSYWELYFGYGLFVSISCLVEALLFWQLATLAKSHPSKTRSIVALFALGEAGYAILMLKYFFLVPIVVHIATAICLTAAFITAGRSSPARPGALAR
jgi:hypothetical protein